MDTYTHLHMEAATCLWEAMIEANDEAWAGALKGVDMRTLWCTIGTVEMRHKAIGLADFVLKVWDCLTQKEQMMLAPYDWEFVPRFLDALEWDLVNHLAVHPADPREFAELILSRA